MDRAHHAERCSEVAVPQPSAGPMYEALREYMTLLDDGCELENRECDCDSDNFHTCETCKEIMGLDYRLRSLRDLWGEKWAIALATMGDAMNNLTVEAFKLDDTFRLKFTLLTIEYIGGAWAYFSAVIEHNSSKGKRRPYLVLAIGPWCFQSGWLFDNDNVAEPSAGRKAGRN